MPNKEQYQKAELLKAYHKAFWSPIAPFGVSFFDPYVLLTLAESYLSIQEFEEAKSLLLTVVNSHPSNADAHLLLGHLYESVESLEQAAFSYLEAITLENAAGGDRMQDIADNITRITEKIPDKQRALNLVTQLRDRDPSNTQGLEIQALACWRQHEFKRAESAFRELLARIDDPDESANVRYSLSRVLIDSEQYDEGISLLESILPVLPSCWDYHEVEHELAEAYFKAGRFDSALKIYIEHSEGCHQSLSKAQTLIRVSRCYEAIGDYTSAIDCLLEILTFVCEDPPLDASWIQRGCVISDPIFFPRFTRLSLDVTKRLGIQSEKRRQTRKGKNTPTDYLSPHKGLEPKIRI
jgi:tetratricopeptide (TPR) repeat protein